MRRALALALTLVALPLRAELPEPLAPVAAEALSVVYGPAAPTREGDPDWSDRLFLSVPVGTAGPLWLRVYDPGFGGPNDPAFGRTNATAYCLYGGPGAYTAAPRPAPQPDGARAAAPDPAAPGILIAQQVYAGVSGSDEDWETLAELDPARGEVADGRVWFRLDVVGLSGAMPNAYAVALSAGPGFTDPPPRALTLAYAPSLRWPGAGDAAAVVVALPAGGTVTVQNFDAAMGALTLATLYEAVALKHSGQDT